MHFAFFKPTELLHSLSLQLAITMTDPMEPIRTHGTAGPTFDSSSIPNAIDSAFFPFYNMAGLGFCGTSSDGMEP
jgi:hypothetical protein